MLRTDNATYSLTVGEGLDEKAFEAMPKKLRDAISSPKEGLSIELAREQLSPAKLKAIVVDTQVTDYVMGKAPDVGQKTHVVDTSVTGATKDEKLASGLANVAAFYDNVSQDHGKVAAMKNDLSTGTTAIKAAAAARSGNTFAPARSQYNGILVSGRQSIKGTDARSTLTPDELKSITVTTMAPDEKKAQEILSPDEFGKIFKAAKVSLRVTEKK